MSIKLKLEGFENLITQIQQAGGTIDRAAEGALKQSAHIMHSELKNQMTSAGVDSDLIARMPPPEIEQNGNAYIARVGYKKGAYNPEDPSDGYKVVFLNYGTPKRSKHGIVTARGFIDEAQRKAKKNIKKAQKEALEKILERVSKT
jgi:hypothetical protein